MKPLTAPPPPNWLSLDAKLKWVEVWRLLDPERFDPAIHADSVAMYCQAYAQWKEALGKIESMGALVKDKNNSVVANPYVSIRDSAVEALLNIGEILGLRPDKALAPVTRWSEVVRVLGGFGDETNDD